MKKRIIVGLLFFVIAQIVVWSIYWASGCEVQRDSNLAITMGAGWFLSLIVLAAGVGIGGELCR